MFLIGGVSGLLVGGGLPGHFAAGAAFGVFHVGPMMWWFQQNSRFNGNAQPANIFYENSATKEEIERFQAQDQIEMLAHQMTAMPGYGLVTRDPRNI